MEKVVYVLTGSDPAHLLGPVADQLLDLGARGLQVNVADDAVAPAHRLRIVTSDTPADAVVSVWVDSAVDHRRQPFDEAVSEAAAGAWAAYLVTESVPLMHDARRPEPGQRTEGVAQVAFLTRHLVEAEVPAAA